MMKGKEKLLENLRYVFEPKSIAVFGASPTPGKLGNVVMKNLVLGEYAGKIYPVNPKYDEVLGHKCYGNVLRVKEKIDCAIVVTPAETVPKIINECGRMGVRGAVVLSGGFSEVGRNDLEEELAKAALRYNISLVGPNCLGIYNPYARVDSNFNPAYKSGRPGPGSISFITQSGAVGACTIDIAAHYGVGIAKFISYGNGSVLNEADYLEYLENDKQTKSIILYIEGAKDGRKLFEAMRKVNRKKPIVAMKAGKYGKAMKAAKSHTGNLAGNYLAYRAAFRQAKVTEAENFDEIFDFIRIFNQPLPRGRRVAVITNGGGMGVLTADALEMHGFSMPELEEKAKTTLRKMMPGYVNIENPLDLVGDAGVGAYDKAIELAMQDKNIDSLIIIVLYQTPRIDERILGVLTRASDDRRKPVAVISVGGSYTEEKRRVLEGYGVPTYAYPLAAVKALEKLTVYSEYRRKKD